MGFIAGWVETKPEREIDAPSKSGLIDRICRYSRESCDKKINSFVVCATPVGQIFATEDWLYAVSDRYDRRQSDFEENLLRYQREGACSLSSFLGKGSLVLADIKQQRLILATDPIGQTHLYYAPTKTGLVFGSTADCVVDHPDVSSEISLQSIYEYIYSHHCPSPDSIYRQVKKLEGGQVLVYQDGKISINYYWLPEFSERSISLKQAGQELQNKIHSAVKNLSVSAETTGAFLSGGLDSSTVAGSLSEVFPGAAKTFSIGFPAEGYDETAYARIASEHFKTEAHEYYVTPDDTVAAVPKIAAYYDEPFGNSSALAAYYCAKLARENGVEILLGGDGGDEIFAGNERYAKQLLFEHYYRIPGSVRSLLRGGLHNAPKTLLENKIIFKAKRYVEQAEIPLPDRLQDYNFLTRHPSDEIFSESFLTEVNTAQPLQILRDCYNRPEQASPLNRMLYMDWKTTLHDNDLVKVNKMCELAGVEVRYPLLDPGIVELSCRIPSADKLKGQRLRWFYKQAMHDFLPEAIINKSKHGFGLPFGVWLKEHQPLKELAYDSINSLKKREYFQEGFLGHAINMHQSIHAAYYGELIWILMMLELWFQARKL